MILHCMTALGLKQMILYPAEIENCKEKNINVEHTLHYLPQTKYSKELEFSGHQLVRSKRNVVKLEREADKPCRIQRTLVSFYKLYFICNILFELDYVIHVR